MNRFIDAFFSKVRGLNAEKFYQSCEDAEINSNTQKFSCLPASKIHRLCEILNVSLYSIINESVDYETVISGEIPKIYQGELSYSSRFTAIYMLNFVRKELGERVEKSVMQRLQLEKILFKNVLSTNTILLPADICNYIGSWFGEDLVHRMGSGALELLRTSQSVEELTHLKFQDFFEKFMLEVLPVSIERNYIWEIEYLSNNKFIVSGKPRDEIQELLFLHGQSTVYLEHLRAGFIKSLPILVGSDFSVIQQTQRYSTGDKRDIYVVYFSPANRPFYH